MKKKKKLAKKRRVQKQHKNSQEVVVFQGKVKSQQQVKRPETLSLSQLSQYDFNLRLLLIPLILIVLLGILSLLSGRVTRELEAERLPDSRTITPDPYAYLNTSIEPQITAEAAIIMDHNSKVVLYKKNSTDRFSMASTTKLMTALVAMEYFAPKDVLTVTTPDVGGQTLSFPLGEQLYFEDLVYAMLLPSSNHAANIIAHNFPGGYDAFIAKMNEKAYALSLYDTHYADPAGLNDQGNYTTVVDLARLASIVHDHAVLSEVTSTKLRTITNVSGTKSYTLSNLNILLGTNGVTGLKTGYTEGAGGVLVTSVNVNGRTFIIVVMRSLDRFGDTNVLLSYLGSDVSYFIPQTLVGESQ